MKLSILTITMATAVTVFAQTAGQPQGQPQGIDPVTMRAQAELEKSKAELAGEEQKIAAAKAPLLAQLNTVETQVKELGAKFDTAARTLDTRNIETTNLTADLQRKQDEIQVLTNILNEFALNLKTAVHPSEMQAFGTKIDAAENAAKNETLEPKERFDKQLDVLRSSLDRVQEVIGGSRFEGEAVTPDSAIVKGKFALLGPIAFFSAGQISGIVKTQAGNPTARPVVYPLEMASINAGIATAVASGEGEMPFDITKGTALQNLVSKGSLWKYYKQGGPIMHPILVLCIMAVAVIIERMFFMILEKIRTSRRSRAAIFQALEAGDLHRASTVSSNSKDYIASMLTYALSHREKSLSDALQNASGRALSRYNRGIVIMETVITLAPLLGLLGTVTGMMGSFGMLGGGEITGTTAITGGIAEALIATAAGLGIAILTVIPMNWLVARQEHAKHEIEDACTHCELLAKPLIEVEAKLAKFSDTSSQTANS
jgi:biopolymer transport protein ExbB